MTAARARRADCPSWCAAGHTSTGGHGRPAPHVGKPAYPGPGSLVSVCPALLGSGDGPEVVIGRALHPLPEARAQYAERPPAWLRLRPDQAVNLAAIMKEAQPGSPDWLIRHLPRDQAVCLAAIWELEKARLDTLAALILQAEDAIYAEAER